MTPEERAIQICDQLRKNRTRDEDEETIAALIREQRERCAKIAEGKALYAGLRDDYSFVAEEIAAAIRKTEGE